MNKYTMKHIRKLKYTNINTEIDTYTYINVFVAVYIYVLVLNKCICICVVSVPPAVSAHPSNRLSASLCADRECGHDGADKPAEDSAAEAGERFYHRNCTQPRLCQCGGVGWLGDRMVHERRLLDNKDRRLWRRDRLRRHHSTKPTSIGVCRNGGHASTCK